MPGGVQVNGQRLISGGHRSCRRSYYRNWLASFRPNRRTPFLGNTRRIQGICPSDERNLNPPASQMRQISEAKGCLGFGNRPKVSSPTRAWELGYDELETGCFICRDVGCIGAFFGVCPYSRGAGSYAAAVVPRSFGSPARSFHPRTSGFVSYWPQSLETSGDVGGRNPGNSYKFS